MQELAILLILRVVVIAVVCDGAIVAVNVVVVVVVVGEAVQVVVRVARAACHGLVALLAARRATAGAAEPRQAALLGVVASLARLGVYAQVLALLAAKGRVVHRLRTQLLTKRLERGHVGFSKVPKIANLPN